MNVVVIIGAGFSKAFSAHMPLMSELAPVARKAVSKTYPVDRLTIPSCYMDDAELLMSYLHQEHPWKSPDIKLIEKACFLAATSTISGYITDAEEKAFESDLPDWLTSFVRWLDDTQCSVITTNYDTVIERAAYLTLDIWTPNLHPVPLTNAWGRLGTAILGGPPKDTFKLFKLHGSTNWYCTGQKGDPTIYYSAVNNRLPSLDHQQDRRSVVDLIPLIVPPVFDKSPWSGQSSLIDRVWQDAYNKLLQENQVCVLGCSFPDTDLPIRSLISSACRHSSKTVHVANLKFDSTIRERYEKIFDGCKLGTVFEGPTAVEDLVNRLLS